MGDCFSAPVALCCGAMFCCYGGARCCAEVIRDPPGYTEPVPDAMGDLDAGADVDSKLRKEEDDEEAHFEGQKPRRRKAWWRPKSKRDSNTATEDEVPL